MSMKVLPLHTYWDADDAHLVISFLDELRDSLWAVYGDDIIEQLQQADHTEDQQLPLEIEEIPI